MYAFDPLQAEFGMRELSKLSQMDETRISNVKQIKQHLESQGKRLKAPIDRDDSKCVFWQFATYHGDAVESQDILHKFKIDTAITSLMILSELPKYSCHNETPVAQWLHDNTLFIPAYPTLKSKDLNRICDALACL